MFSPRPPQAILIETARLISYGQPELRRVVSGLVITRGLVHIWELGDFNKDANPWPMFKRTGARVSAYNLHLENPIFDSEYSTALGVDLLTVSVEVYPGLFPVVGLDFTVVIDGEIYRSTMADNGANSDLLPGMAVTRLA